MAYKHALWGVMGYGVANYNSNTGIHSMYACSESILSYTIFYAAYKQMLKILTDMHVGVWLDGPGSAKHRGWIALFGCQYNYYSQLTDPREYWH